MHTAEEYFAALEECLKQMPAAERAETITYYWEYAQEGGLLDAEQLEEHFGPPQVLAARILQDDADKRARNTTKGTGGAGVRPGMVLFGIVIAVAALGIGLFNLFRPAASADSSVPAATALAGEAGTAAPDETALPSDTGEDGALPRSYDGEVAPFTDISIDVVAAKIKVEIGDTYALRYTLREKEVVERAGVEDGTLYLVSHNIPDQDNSDGFGDVYITVPADAKLGTLTFSTIGGGVTVPELPCDSVSVNSVAGNTALDCTVQEDVTVDSTAGNVEFGGQCRQLRVNTSAGGLTFSGQADTVNLDTIAGKLDFTGTAGSLEMNSTSGDARIEGTVSEQVEVNMTTGNISVAATDPTVEADGHSIEYNGQRMSGPSWSRQGTGCTLNLSTSFGSISIQEP